MQFDFAPKMLSDKFLTKYWAECETAFGRPKDELLVYKANILAKVLFLFFLLACPNNGNNYFSQFVPDFAQQLYTTGKTFPVPQNRLILQHQYIRLVRNANPHS